MLVCSNGPKGLAHGLVDPLATLTLVLRLKIVSLDFMHPLINKSVQQRLGCARVRPRPVGNCLGLAKHNLHRLIEKIKSVHEKCGHTQ